MTATQADASGRRHTDDLLTLSKDTLVTGMGFDEARILPAASFAEMGIDSVMFVELKVILERRLGIKIPLELLSFDDSLERFTEKVADLME
ncbi:acyl carrier protein [Kitasatospora sp. NPDC057512]|uniref:acyl carrier protein n=1 Tax=Kitasatospora sp. NPDC057512 TaxID=3346154 RepID=UPI0036B7F1E3